MRQVALVGFGYWGEKLARVIQNSTFANLRWCCDISESNLETAKKLFPAANVTTKLYDVLKDKNVSAVIIATPAKSHYMIAKEALLAGKHVLVENNPCFFCVFAVNPTFNQFFDYFLVFWPDFCVNAFLDYVVKNFPIDWLHKHLELVVLVWRLCLKHLRFF